MKKEKIYMHFRTGETGTRKDFLEAIYDNELKVTKTNSYEDCFDFYVQNGIFLEIEEKEKP